MFLQFGIGLNEYVELINLIISRHLTILVPAGDKAECKASTKNRT
jgi:hypothetical protein